MKGTVRAAIAEQQIVIKRAEESGTILYWDEDRHRGVVVAGNKPYLLDWADYSSGKLFRLYPTRGDKIQFTPVDASEATYTTPPRDFRPHGNTISSLRLSGRAVKAVRLRDLQAAKEEPPPSAAELARVAAARASMLKRDLARAQARYARRQAREALQPPPLTPAEQMRKERAARQARVKRGREQYAREQAEAKAAKSRTAWPEERKRAFYAS